MEFKHIDSVALPHPTSEVSNNGLFHDDHTEYLVSCLKWFAHCAGVAGDMGRRGGAWEGTFRLPLQPHVGQWTTYESQHVLYLLGCFCSSYHVHWQIPQPKYGWMVYQKRGVATICWVHISTIVVPGWWCLYFSCAVSVKVILMGYSCRNSQCV